MNKVLQINLGGYPFTIDDDAYKQLDAYIKSIRQHFSGMDAYEEITTDIEARLAELFQERLGNRPIVSIKDVEEVIARMGQPEEFGADAMGDDKDSTKAKTGTQSEYKTGKRLFRNPDETVIAGVCSGIAAYFGISDPLWVRLAFVLIALSGGFGVPVYIILWAIVPKAGSASDRLAMRGEPINVSNIGKIIQEEFGNLSKKVSEFSEELGNKSKDQKFAKDLSNNIDLRVHQIVEGVGAFLKKLLDNLSAVWKPILFIIAIILILMLLAAWVAAIFAAFVSPPIVFHFFPEHTRMASLGFISMMFVVGIPLLSTALGCFRLIFGTRLSPFWRSGLAIFWGLNIGYLFFLGSAGVAQFAEKATSEQRMTLNDLGSDTLKLEIVNNPDRDKAPLFSWIDNEEIYLPPAEANIYIRKSENDQFYIIQENSAHGQDHAEAFSLANKIPMPYTLEGNTIKVKNWLSIGEQSKWRIQEVKLTVYVPEGKYLHTNRWRNGRVRVNASYEDQDTNMWSFNNNLWQMKADGLACQDCIKEAPEEKAEEEARQSEAEKLSMVETAIDQQNQ